MSSTLDRIILPSALILANLRASMFIFLHPDTSVLLGPAWIEIALWCMVTGIAIYRVVRENQGVDYLSRWGQNWPLGLFLILALVSSFWSVEPLVTVFQALELLFATLVAAYIGMRHRPDELMAMLFWFGTVLLILSISLVFAAPKTGTMYWAPFHGAWRGVYWHRNHLGSITALLSSIWMCRILLAAENRNSTGLLDGLFYGVSLLVLYFAESATAYVLFVTLHFCVFGFWLWVRLFHRLRRWHYYALSAVLMAGLVLVLSNLQTVFRLLNRSPNLTGRVELWEYLLKEVVTRRPWWGYGFGSLWTLDGFREQVRMGAGWTSQPLIGDNGYLDIGLHLGIAGLLLLLGVLVITTVRSLRYALSHRSLPAFVPVLVTVYALLANITFSLFAETEVFVWFLIVAVLFVVTPLPGQPGR